MDTNNKGIIHAYTINGDGYGKELLGAKISQTIKDNDLAWVHLDTNCLEAREWLKSEVTYLDQIIIDALLAEETRPRMLEFESGVLLILRGINFDEAADPEDMVALRLWIDSNRIISLQKRPIRVINYLKNRLMEGKGPKDSSEFITLCISRLFDRMENVFAELSEKLDDVEDKIIENPTPEERQEISTIRRQAIMFRRYIAPQREVIAHLRTSELSWIDVISKRRLQESLDQVIRYIEDLDTIRERAQIIKDELTNALSDRMNKNLYMLSIISAIFLPLSFLTGLLGINVGGIPGVNNSSAFILFCIILVVIFIIQLVLFRRWKWM